MFRVWIAFSLLLLASCSRSTSTWEDVKTAGRYMQKGVDSMLGKDYESRMLSSDDDFTGPYDEDFIPLSDKDLRRQLSEKPIPAAKVDLGQFGIPSLDQFYRAPDKLKSLFSTIHFETDQHVIKHKEEVASLLKLAKHLKENQGVYLIVEGHCDERASASYNMALGMRRANAVRSFLVKHGADLNRIYTISKGKEQPVALGHSGEDWKINRRTEFRIFEK